MSLLRAGCRRARDIDGIRVTEAKNEPLFNLVHSVIGPIMNDENGSALGESNGYENDGPKWCRNSRSARNQSSSDEPKGPPLFPELIGEFLNLSVENI
jgi:hypothetical protein